MGRMNEHIFALNVGGVDEEALSRIDLEKMRLAGVWPVPNWLPRVLGPMMLRPGLEYLYGMPSNNYGRAIPFIFSRAVNYDLLFTANEMRIEQDGALLQVADSASTLLNPDFDSALAGSYATGWVDDSDGSATAAIAGGKLTLTAQQSTSAKVQQSTAIAGGDQATLHTLRLVIDRGPIFLRIGSSADAEDLVAETELDTGTHKITFTPGVATVFFMLRSEDEADRIVDQVIFEHTALGGAGDLVVPTPWDADQIDDLRWFQSANTLFLGDGNQQQYKVERRSDRSWSVVEYKADSGPFSTLPARHITMTPSGNDGNITITSSEDFFTADDVGSLIELTHDVYDRTQLLDGPDQATSHITIRGVGANNRDYGRGATASGFSGTLTLERSYDPGNDPITWQVANEFSGNQAFATQADTQDNVTVHYRWKIKSSNHSAGSMDCRLFYKGMNVTGVGRITGYTSATQVDVEVIDFFGHSIATRDWRIGNWSTRRGWPRVPVIYDGRLWWFRDDIAFGSVSDDFTNFDDDVDGDSGPIVRSVGSGPVEGVLWALGLQRLIAGTTGFEASIRASSFDEPLTPTQFTVKDASTLGSSDIPAVKHDRGAFYVDSGDDRLNELYYSAEANDYTSRDLTRLLPNSFSSGFKRLAIQRRPDTRVYALLNDGTCVVMTFERDDEVIAFTQITTPGGEIEDVTVRRGSTRDFVTMIVKRTIDGNTVRYREQLDDERNQQSKSTCMLLDSAAVYSGVAVTTASALCTHLEGETVRVFADGVYEGTQVVPASGDITVSTASTRIVAGLAYTAKFTSTKLAYAGGLGTAIGQKKRISNASLLLTNSCLDGILIGRDENNTTALPKKYKGATLAADELVSHYDAPSTVIPNGWDTDSRIYIEATGPWPCTVQGIPFEIETFDASAPPTR